MVQFSATSFDTTGVFVALTMIGLIVLAGNWTTNRVERRLLRWRNRSGDHGTEA